MFSCVTGSGAERSGDGKKEERSREHFTMFSCVILHQCNTERSGAEQRMFSCVILHQCNTERSGTGSAPFRVTLMMDKAPEHCKMFPRPFCHIHSARLHRKMFPGVNLIKIFWLYYKLGHFINIRNIYCIATRSDTEWSGERKNVQGTFHTHQ